MKPGEPFYIFPRSLVRNTAVVVLSTWAVTLYIAYDFGLQDGQDMPKVCARVPGHEVVSSTVDTCTYATAYGRATKVRRAM